MPFYTKKPIPIEAHQITIEIANELAAWSNSDVVRGPDGTITGMRVYTLEGAMTGAVNDYLIRGVRGEFYFCKQNIKLILNYFFSFINIIQKHICILCIFIF